MGEGEKMTDGMEGRCTTAAYRTAKREKQTNKTNRYGKRKDGARL